MKKELLINDEATTYSLATQSDGSYLLELDGQTFKARPVERNNQHLIVEVDGRNHFVWRAGAFVSLSEQTVTVESARDKRKKKGAGGADNEMSSPMPGKILKVMVKAGDQVEAGQGLLVMEAMKMEHTIKAAATGTIKQVFYKEGDLVDGGVDLVDLEVNEET